MSTKRIAVVVFGVLLIGALAACEKKGGEGPAERAGKEVDKVVDQLGKKVDEASDKVKESTKK